MPFGGGIATQRGADIHEDAKKPLPMTLMELAKRRQSYGPTVETASAFKEGERSPVYNASGGGG